MASTTVTILVSVRTMLDRSHVTVREVIQGTEYCVEVKLFFFVSNFPFSGFTRMEWLIMAHQSNV